MADVDATRGRGDTPPTPFSREGNGALVLADGSVFWGVGCGAVGGAVGEVCFNTSITGYQEIMTDPSYAGQIITFTFPHIGNVGANDEDMEAAGPAARGCVLRAPITGESNWRAAQHLDAWLKAQNLVAVTGIDTRRLTGAIRDGGAPHGVVVHGDNIDVAAAQAAAAEWPGLEGMDLAKEVSCTAPYAWDQTRWDADNGFGTREVARHRVVAVDFGAKRNILRCLASLGCELTVVPATVTADEVLAYEPDGVFLANGPGDPAATGAYAVDMVKGVLAQDLPVFGICLGHQILALALGAKTLKMHHGHRGANHPVKDLDTGRVEITSQNHGFAVDGDSLPAGVSLTHTSLFDGSVEGLRVDGRPVFSVQYHPEASPGPQDSHYLFQRFVDAIAAHKVSG